MAKYRHEVLGVPVRVGGEGLEVLVAPRAREPFAGRPALPGGPLEVDEGMDEALVRHLGRHLDGAAIGHLEQVATFSDPTRDPFERTVATAYLVLVGPDDWPPSGDARWCGVEDLEPMAFDHARVLAVALERLRGKVSYTNIAWALAPEEFTIAQLRQVYRACLGHDVDPTNLTRVLERRAQIERTGRRQASGHRGGRPAATWRFTRRVYEVTDPFAALGPAGRGFAG